MSGNKPSKPTTANDSARPSDNSRVAPLTGQINESKNTGIATGTVITNTKPAPDPKGGSKGK